MSDGRNCAYPLARTEQMFDIFSRQNIIMLVAIAPKKNTPPSNPEGSHKPSNAHQSRG
jgi:hypothetical protein